MTATSRDFEAIGITYRRLDTWTRGGHLKLASSAQGPGIDRVWADGEVQVAKRILALTEAGLTLAKASAVARDVTTNDRATCQLATGIYLVVGGPGW